MAAAALLVSSVNPAFLGTASRVTNALANGEFDLLRGAMGSGVSIAVAALIMLLVRAAGTYLTTGSGMSAGLTAPAIQVGMLAAILVSRVASPLADPLLLSGFLVVGFSGMLAGAMNVPIAAAVLGMEVFGAGLGMPAAIASIAAFQMNRHATIYDYALAGSGHLDEA
jgi:H+/Cl- antiporter ClcA